MIYIRTMNIAPNRLDRAETGEYMVAMLLEGMQNIERRRVAMEQVKLLAGVSVN